MMENEERHASYAAVAGSKVQQSESVLDDWEEAAQDGQRSQELERSIEAKLGKMKQKQSGLIPASTATTSNHSGVAALDDTAVQRSFQGESRSSADLTTAAPAPAPIRILKRPQSSGHLPQQNQQHRHDQAKQSTSIHVAKNGSNLARSGQQQQQQRTLEERAAAYAEARMRIFGVADQQIHDDLPVQPNLSMAPRSDQSSPSSSANR